MPVDLRPPMAALAMSVLRAAVVLTVLLATTLHGRAAPPYEAGVARITVEDVGGPFETMVWYPTPDPEIPWHSGAYTVHASLDAAIAGGQRFPVVLFSHGSGGTPLGHRDLAASLARAGFVVVAPTHVGDAAGFPRAPRQSQILMGRSRQALEALDAALRDGRFADHVDQARVGMIGYSAGGYTALVLAGARPDFAAAAAYCAQEGRSDIGSCGPPRDGTSHLASELEDWQPPVDHRLKALVLMDPLSMPFRREGLSAVRIPALLFRPEDDSYLNAGHNALALARDLPDPPEQIVVPGRHFVFLDPCPDRLVTVVPDFCQDAPGVDRAAIHRKMEDQIAAFLHEHL